MQQRKVVIRTFQKNVRIEKQGYPWWRPSLRTVTSFGVLPCKFLSRFLFNLVPRCSLWRLFVVTRNGDFYDSLTIDAYFCIECCNGICVIPKRHEGHSLVKQAKCGVWVQSAWHEKDVACKVRRTLDIPLRFVINLTLLISPIFEKNSKTTFSVCWIGMSPTNNLFSGITGALDTADEDPLLEDRLRFWDAVEEISEAVSEILSLTLVAFVWLLTWA